LAWSQRNLPKRWFRAQITSFLWCFVKQTNPTTEGEAMVQRFRNRKEAGLLLAKELAAYEHLPNVLILAFPRGGVPVGFEIAKALHVPLDVVLVRKLGVPGHEELAMGAIATGGGRLLNDSVVRMFQISRREIEWIGAKEELELQRRERLYRGGQAEPVIRDHAVILVDDGIATGATMRVAIAALRAQRPGSITVAIPVGPMSTCEELRTEVQQVVCLRSPREFEAISLWYEDFTQVTDEEVCDLLERANRERYVPAPVQ
jgi:putative phosphoribosyl transferase